MSTAVTDEDDLAGTRHFEKPGVQSFAVLSDNSQIFFRDPKSSIQHRHRLAQDRIVAPALRKEEKTFVKPERYQRTENYIDRQKNAQLPEKRPFPGNLSYSAPSDITCSAQSPNLIPHWQPLSFF
ncbi:MAG TPA: hypothetical protein V6C97_06755 [Oculatellaceae cyanobacterium]